MDLEYMNQGGMNQFTSHFFLVNQVEHQKRTQPALEVGLFRFVFGGQHGFRWTQTLIIIYAISHHHHTECILASYWMHPGQYNG